MDFEKIIKYAGFALTVISLVVGLDYFIHNVYISAPLVVSLAAITIIIYYTMAKNNRLFGLKILYHEVIIDLQDINGELAIHTRKTRFEALQDNITSFTDHMSADGDLIDPTVHPGLIEEIRREGGDLFVRSNFGRVLKKGDVIEKEIKAKLKDTFKSQPEYWSVRIILPTKEFKLIIIFPKDRPYKNFKGLQRITSHEIISRIQPNETLISQRPALVWVVKNPEIKDVYKLVWDW